jgi:hypothetical protein
MSDFQNFQAGLANARLQNSQAQKDLLLSKAAKERALRDLATLRRGKKPNDQTYLAKENDLLERIDSLDKQIGARYASIGGIKADISGLLGSLLQLGDPTEQIAELPSALPFLLFPLRVQTRFKLKANEPRRQRRALDAHLPGRLPGQRLRTFAA